MTDLISLFTNSLAAANKQASTLSQYADDLRRFERFLQEEYGLSLTAQQAGKIRAYMLDAYAQWLFRRVLEISTHNKYIIELKRFFGYLHDAELIPGDPAKILHCIKEPDSAKSPDARKDIYTPDQLQAFLSAIASGREHCNDRRDIASHKRLSTTNRYTHTTHEERAALVVQNAFASAVQQAVK